MDQQDAGMDTVIQRILERQSSEGPFQTLMQLYKRFGGVDGEHWVWMGCDAPVLLYALAAFGLDEHPRVIAARDHLINLIRDNGWPCSAAASLGKFKGPGKADDPCPIANLQALKALSQFESCLQSKEILPGLEMLLHHWEIREEKKYFLFGVGTDYKKLKYPMIWYDILHTADVLSRFPAAISDPRFRSLIDMINNQMDQQGRYTASSMYMAWKGWSFADKKQPSPWLTFLVMRIQKRAGLL
jgi:hypothetical protein